MSASLGSPHPRALDFYYRYWFRVETEADRERPPRRWGAPPRRPTTPARPAPDAPMIMQAIRNEHPGRVPSTCSASIGSRATRQLGMLANKMRPRSTPHSRQRPAAARRRGPRCSISRLPRGPRRAAAKAPSAALPASPLRPRGLRPHRDPRRRTDRCRSRLSVARRRCRSLPTCGVAAAWRADLLPAQPRLPPLRPRGGAMYLPAKFNDPLPRAGRHVRLSPGDGRRRGRGPVGRRADPHPDPASSST